ncbi:MAG TPA: type II toxin-antitoxin system RelE/ParE family toxin [Gammaproteobacteria bacterium]|nr:type II toxin-antitoxin system RelE/ParE family toxin [Gammaproteobacteria bacterium]
MKWKLAYYNYSVEQEVDCLEKSINSKFIAITDMMIENGPNLGMPFTRPMGKGLFEIRAKGHAGIARGFFCTVSKNTIIILHVFVKKIDQTPNKELKLARQRMKEVKIHDI